MFDRALCVARQIKHNPHGSPPKEEKKKHNHFAPRARLNKNIKFTKGVHGPSFRFHVYLNKLLRFHVSSRLNFFFFIARFSRGIDKRIFFQGSNVWKEANAAIWRATSESKLGVKSTSTWNWWSPSGSVARSTWRTTDNGCCENLQKAQRWRLIYRLKMTKGRHEVRLTLYELRILWDLTELVCCRYYY